MKVGDYVRTEISSLNLQRIGKIKKIISEDFIHTDIGTYDKENIIKSSSNITDLIEAGDYVNGKQVEWVGYDLYKEHNNGELEGIGEKRVLFNSFTKDSVRQSGIKSIVTKEQFKSMEYKIEEK